MARKTKADRSETNATSESKDASGYEQSREQRIEENKLRLQKLGILDLSTQLKSDSAAAKRVKRNPPEKKSSEAPSRRSSRAVTRVNYAEARITNPKGKSDEEVVIHIKEGSEPEIYTEEHEKALGDCEKEWEVMVDGYGEDGQRIYDPHNGKSCHQCRQKTLGHRTNCSRCKIVQGQFCGDCLYTRYGENVLEANEKPDWICPVCRDICNCSRCRRVKGWEPTGQLHTKVRKLGFKSVAHYLIQTRQFQAKQEEAAADSPLAAAAATTTTTATEANGDGDETKSPARGRRRGRDNHSLK